MGVLHIVGLDLLDDARGRCIGREGSEHVATSAVDKDVLVAGEVVEAVGAGEKNSRLADVELVLAVPELVAA